VMLRARIVALEEALEQLRYELQLYGGLRPRNYEFHGEETPGRMSRLTPIDRRLEAINGRIDRILKHLDLVEETIPEKPSTTFLKRAAREKKK